MKPQYIIIPAIITLVLLTVLYITTQRIMNNIAVMTKVVEPKEGIECVIATSTDGVGIDCNWD